MTTSFKTNPESLKKLMEQCGAGSLQLPDFQRGWVWDQDRIVDLLASISEGFPIGALMTLDASGEMEFATRPVEGANPNNPKLEGYLLDGQQRMTSLFQSTSVRTPVATKTAKGRPVHLHFYFDIRAAVDSNTPQSEAIVPVPEDRIVRENFGRDIKLDLSSEEKEFEHLHFPIDRIFDANSWQQHLWGWVRNDIENRQKHMDLFSSFWSSVITNFNDYQVPVITLGKDTSRAAVCLVFEKVNTGGKALDAFELVTAMYAASGFKLRDDWKKRREELLAFPQLTNVEAVEFLQVISLLHTKSLRLSAQQQGTELPAVSASRQSLLQLPLDAYERYADQVQAGYKRAAKFLHQQRIYRAWDLPYQSQLVPLAAILAELGDTWENDVVRQKVGRWYWCGVLGELYGSAVETRFGRDILDFSPWLDGGSEPLTVQDANFREERLRTLRSRLSAAYKGMNAILMKRGAEDFLSGQPYDHTVFFDENVDIHHIFPRAWCEKQGIQPAVFNSIINKTPLAARTNRILGGTAPSAYLARLEKGGADSPAIPPERLDDLIASHEIPPELLRADDFAGFFEDRRERLLGLIEGAMGKPAVREDIAPPDEDAMFVSEEELEAEIQEQAIDAQELSPSAVAA